MTNKQLAGQRLMVGFNGTDLNEDLKFLIKQLKVGGIILFAQNLKTPAQIAELCGGIQNYAKLCELSSHPVDVINAFAESRVRVKHAQSETSNPYLSRWRPQSGRFVRL